MVVRCPSCMVAVAVVQPQHGVQVQFHSIMLVNILSYIVSLRTIVRSKKIIHITQDVIFQRSENRTQCPNLWCNIVCISTVKMSLLGCSRPRPSRPVLCRARPGSAWAVTSCFGNDSWLHHAKFGLSSVGSCLSHKLFLKNKIINKFKIEIWK